MANPYGDTPITAQGTQPPAVKKVPNPYNDLPAEESGSDKSLWQNIKEGASTLAGTDFGKSRENAPESIGRTMEAILKPVFRPRDFVKEEVATLGKAWLENFMDGLPGMGEVETPTRDAMVKGLKDRYGGAEQIRNTVETDPAGFFMDIVATGFTAKAAAHTARAGTAGVAATLYSDDLPISMYQSAAKFSTTLPEAKRRFITETLIKEKVPLTAGGVKKALDTIGALDEFVGKVIAASDTGIRYPREWTVRQLNALADSKIGQLGGGKDAAVIRKVVDDYLKDLEGTNPTMSLTELHEWKQNAYKRINWRVATEKQTAKNEAYKTAASTARGDIESLTPGTQLAEANSREGALINALEHLDKSVSRGGNNNFIGMDQMLKPAQGGMGAYAFGIDPSIGMGLGALASLAGKPGLKSKLAIAMYHLRRLPEGSPARASLARAMAAAGEKGVVGSSFLAQGREEPH